MGTRFLGPVRLLIEAKLQETLMISEAVRRGFGVSMQSDQTNRGVTLHLVTALEPVGEHSSEPVLQEKRLQPGIAGVHAVLILMHDLLLKRKAEGIHAFPNAPPASKRYRSVAARA